jgi:hypothetical protein
LELACKIILISDWRGVPATTMLKTRAINPVLVGYWGLRNKINNPTREH